MKKRTNSFMVNERLNNKKALLYVAAVMAILVDAFLTVFAFVSGVSPVKAIKYIIISVFDISLIFVVANSNFRFKYSRIFPFIHVFVCIVFTVLFIIDGFGIYTIPALLSFVITHVFAEVALIINVFNAAKLGKGVKFFAVLLLAMFIGVSGYYTYQVATKGVFGQGGIGYKNIIFTLDADSDTYIADDILEGKGNVLVIPKEYNGKKVSAINCKLFTDSDIDTIHFDCAIDVAFTEHENLTDFNNEVDILVNKDSINPFKNNILEIVKDQNKQYRWEFLNLFNCSIPKDLSSDQRFVTFDYTKDSILYAKYNVIDVWVGTKGDTFSLTQHANDISYAKNYSLNSEAYLQTCYNVNAKAMNPLTFDGNNIDEEPVNVNKGHVEVSFQNVYAVRIGNSNDNLYQIPEAFKSFNGSGYRYVLQDDRSRLLSQLEGRTGFNLSWKYSSNENPLQKDLDGSSITSVVQKQGITLYPQWELKKPSLTYAKTNNQLNSFIYGNDILFSSQAQHDNNAISLKYEWFFEGEKKNDGKEYQLLNAFPSQSGTYKLKVTAYSNSMTSLTSSIERDVEVNVAKKPITFNWSLPNNVYSGVDKTINVNYNSSDVINGDSITRDIYIDDVRSTSVRDAGEYDLSIRLTNACAELYEITSQSATNEFEIIPYRMNVSWGASHFVYNGLEQIPSCEATPIGDDSVVDISVWNAQKNAGSYVANVKSNDGNYEIINNTIGYTIDKKGVVVSWDTTSTFEYDGEIHGRVVSQMEGIIVGEEGDVYQSIIYSGKSKQAATHNISVSFPQNSNYFVESGNSSQYEITPKPITLLWANTELTYNAKLQHPTAYSDDVCGSDDLMIKYSDQGNKNTGSYSVSATVENHNYNLISGNNTNYSINQRSISAVWGTTQLTYNAKAQRPSCSLSNVCAGDNVALSFTDTSSNINVGSYSVYVSISDGNYLLDSISATKDYDINQKQLTLKWSTSSFTYNGTAQSPTATFTGTQGTDVIALTYSDVSHNINRGSYQVEANIDNSNYYIDAAEKVKTYAINRRSVYVVWSGSSFVYNGSAQGPTVDSVTNVVSGDEIGLSTTSINANINAGSYSVYASVSNDNYAISSGSVKSYTIAKKPVTLTWEDKTFTYNGNNQYPLATASGFVGSETVNLSYSNYGKSAGNYTVRATLASNTNYVIEGSNAKSYTIDKRIINLVWGGTSFVYNGSTQRPSVISKQNVVSGDVVNITYSAGRMNAGTYTVEANVSNSNYIISESSKSISYTIAKKAVTIEFSEINEFIEDGAVKTFEAETVTGILQKDSVKVKYTYYKQGVALDGAPSEAGEYTVWAYLSNTTNYTLNSPTTATFKIVERSVDQGE